MYECYISQFFIYIFVINVINKMSHEERVVPLDCILTMFHSVPTGYTMLNPLWCYVILLFDMAAKWIQHSGCRV